MWSSLFSRTSAFHSATRLIRSLPWGVSVYARAFQSGLLCEADRQFQRLMWEYEGGELAIDASSDAFKTVGGRPELPSGKERLYRMNTLDPNTTSEELMKTFSPQLRDESYANGLESIKREIEDSCGLARGALSKAEEEAKTCHGDQDDPDSAPMRP